MVAVKAILPRNGPAKQWTSVAAVKEKSELLVCPSHDACAGIHVYLTRSCHGSGEEARQCVGEVYSLSQSLTTDTNRRKQPAETGTRHDVTTL